MTEQEKTEKEEENIRKSVERGERCPKCRQRRTSTAAPCGPGCLVGVCYLDKCPGCKVCQ